MDDGCGRVMGHGEYCTEGRLCGSCRRIAELEAEVRQLEHDLEAQARTSNDAIVLRNREVERLRGLLERVESYLMGSGDAEQIGPLLAEMRTAFRPAKAGEGECDD